MADIKQAAKWLQEGRRVRRPFLDKRISIGASQSAFFPKWLDIYQNGVPARDRRTAPFTIDDLMADDWEVSDDQR